jgi:Flp pilus assembly pilin Flp
MDSLSALQSLNTYDEDFAKSLKTYHILLKISLSYLDQNKDVVAQDAAEKIVNTLKFKNDTIKQGNKRSIAHILQMPKRDIILHIKACEKTLEITEPTKFAFITYLEAYNYDLKTTKPKIRVQIVNGKVKEVKAKKTDWKIIARWIAVLPVAIASFLAANFIGGLLSDLETFILNKEDSYYFLMIGRPMLRGLTGGFCFIWTGVLIAPSQNERVNMILYRIIAVFMTVVLIGMTIQFSTWFKASFFYIFSTITETICVIIGSTIAYFYMKDKYSDYR